MSNEEVKEQQENLESFVDTLIEVIHSDAPEKLSNDKLDMAVKTIKALGTAIKPLVGEVPPAVVGASLLYFGAALMKSIATTGDQEADIIEEVTGVKL